MSYYKEPKDINKSIRITKTVNDYIQSHDGNGFNDKLEKMVLKFRNDEKQLDTLLDVKRKEYQDLCTKISNARALATQLDYIHRYLDYATEIVKEDMPSLFD